MKISRRKISRQTDDALVALWHETSRDEYAGVLAVRYLPFVYGALLDASGDQDRARDDSREFCGRFHALLSGYGGDDFAAWLYGELAVFVRERYPDRGDETRMPTAAQAEFMRALASGDENAREMFGTAGGGLAKPRRECIRRFFPERATFETIAGQTGYLTDNVRSYIEAGVADIVPDGDKDGDGVETSGGVSRIAQFRESYIAYLRGERDDEDAWEMELESMFDRFLSMAVGGCTRVDGDHGRIVAELDRELSAACFKPRRNLWWLAVIAVILAVTAGVFAYYKYIRTAESAVVPVTTAVPTLPDAQTGPSAGNGIEGYGGGSDTLNIAPSGRADTMNLAVTTNADETDAAVTGDPDETDAPTLAAGGQHEYVPLKLVSVSEKSGTSHDGKTRYVSVPKIGMDGYNEFLKKASIYSGEETGDVTVEFNVNIYGRPSQIRVVEYLSPEAHREAIRLLDAGPEWSPSQERVRVVMRFGRE